MLWKKTWEWEAALALLGGILAAYVFGGLSVGLLQHAGVRGFRSEYGLGCVLLATLSFHGSALVLGTGFLKFCGLSWCEVFGFAGWKRSLFWAVLVLVAAAPVVLALKGVSEWGMERLHWDVQEQDAVQLFLGVGFGLRLYLIFFAVILAPWAEEFVFRGLLFSLAKQLGWPKLGGVVASLLFALMHANAPTFIPLFVLALALTWLYAKTEGLLAPVLAHSLFNASNLVALLQEPLNHPLPHS